MLKSSAKKEYQEKIKQYKKFSKKYFEDSAPIVSDYDFDLLKKEILDLEKKFDFKDKESPSNTLGFTPSKNFQKFPHRVKMLSLANAFNEDDLINFENRQGKGILCRVPMILNKGGISWVKYMKVT